MKKWQRILYHPNLPLGEDERRVTASAKRVPQLLRFD
jgi:hypothetical protein